MTSSEHGTDAVWYRFEFTGTAGEYFTIWIVNLLLSVITLGIYSAWAKVRTLAYFYGHTTINGSGFSFTADPVKILKGRIVAVCLFGVYWVTTKFYPEHVLWAVSVLLLLFPFLLVTALSFRLRNTAFRNIRFHFNPDFAGAYRIFIVPVLIILALTWVFYSMLETSDLVHRMQQASKGQFHVTDMLISILLLSAMVFIPYFVYLRSRFMVEHASYGSSTARFNAGAWDYYKYHLLAVLMFAGVGFVASFLFGLLAVFARVASHNAHGPAHPELLGIGMVVLIYGVGFFILGYLNARLTNLTVSAIEFGGNRLQCRMRAMAVGWIYLSNTIAIILSLGLLIPWAMVRMARYKAACTEIQEQDFNSIVAVAQPDRSAIGEEIIDVFDFDIGF